MHVKRAITALSALVCAQKAVYFIYSHGIGVHERALQLSSLANIRHC